MVARVGSIEVLFRANYGQFSREVGSSATAVERGSDRMNRAVRSTDRSVLGLQRTMSNLRGREFRVLALSALRAQNSVERLRGTLLATTALLGGFGAAFTLRGIQEYSDTYKEVGNRLRIVKGEAQGLEQIENKIFDVAQRSRSQYKATGILFARIAASARKLNIQQRDTLRVTETIQKAFLVGGSTNVESAQSAIQFSQGIASDRLQGDELRSVLENPALGQLLADKITDGDIGALREIAAEGKLTARTLIKAFKDSSEEIDRLFEGTQQTIGQAFTKVDNALLKYIGRSDAVQSSTNSVVLLLNALAENFDSVADSIVILAGALAGLYGARALGGLSSRLNASLTAFKANRVEMLRTAEAARTLANAELASANTRFLNTQIAVNKVLDNKNSTLKQVIRAEKSLEASTRAYVVAERNAIAANAAHATTLRALSSSATVARAGITALSGALSFVGGPVGATILALGGIMYLVGQNSAEAAERAGRYAEAIRRAGDNSSSGANGIRSAAEELAKVTEAASQADQAIRLRQARNDVAAFTEELNGLSLQFSSFNNKMSDIRGAAFFSRALENLREQFIRGNIDLKEFIDQTDELSKGSEKFQDLAAKAQALARNIDAARGTVDGLTGALEDLGAVADNLSFPDVYGALRGVAEYQKSIRDLEAGVRKQIDLENLRGEAYDKAKAGANAAAEAERVLKSAKKDGIEGTQSEIDSLTKLITKRNLAANARKEDERQQRKAESEARSRARRTGRRAERDLDRYNAKLAEIEQKAATIDLSKIDQEALSVARSLKVPADELEQFVSAVTGAGGTVPASIARIREALQTLQQAEFDKKLRELSQSNVLVFLSDLDRKTVETARSFDVAEDQVRAFIRAASTGDIQNIPPQIADIRRELEGIAQNERIVSFADDLADAFANFAGAAIQDFDNIEDAAKNLLKQISQLIIQFTVLEPFKRSLSSGFKAGFSGGSPAGAGGFGSILSAFFHEGGKVGSDAPKKAAFISSSQVASAPRFHSGLNSKEFSAVLERGERVLTESQDSRTVGTIAGLSQALASKSGGMVEVGIKVTPNAYFDAHVGEIARAETNEGIKQYNKSSGKRVAQAQRGTNVRNVRP